METSLSVNGFSALAQRISANGAQTYSLTLAEAIDPLLNGSTGFAIVGTPIVNILGGFKSKILIGVDNKTLKTNRVFAFTLSAELSDVHLLVGNSLATAYIAAQHCEMSTTTPELREKYGIGVYATTANTDFLVAMALVRSGEIFGGEPLRVLLHAIQDRLAAHHFRLMGLFRV